MAKNRNGLNRKYGKRIELRTEQNKSNKIETAVYLFSPTCETNGMLQIFPCLCNIFVSAYTMSYKTYDFVLQNKHFHCTPVQATKMDARVMKQYEWRISILIIYPWILVAKWATSFWSLVAHRQDLVALASGRAVPGNLQPCKSNQQTNWNISLVRAFFDLFQQMWLTWNAKL